MSMPHDEHRLNGEALRRFLLGGRAIMTLENPQTGNRFTYRITKAPKREGDQRPATWFVKVLTGPDNESSYTYFGFLRDGRFCYAHGKSRIAQDAKSVVAFDWMWKRLFYDEARSEEHTSELQSHHDLVC